MIAARELPANPLLDQQWSKVSLPVAATITSKNSLRDLGGLDSSEKVSGGDRSGISISVIQRLEVLENSHPPNPISTAAQECVTRPAPPSVKQQYNRICKTHKTKLVGTETLQEMSRQTLFDTKIFKGVNPEHKLSRLSLFLASC